jgi:hypothetical protein
MYKRSYAAWLRLNVRQQMVELPDVQAWVLKKFAKQYKESAVLRVVIYTFYRASV